MSEKEKWKKILTALFENCNSEKCGRFCPGREDCFELFGENLPPTKGIIEEVVEKKFEPIEMEFINYTGEWPNLCRGILTISVGGEIFNLSQILISGGDCSFSSDYSSSDVSSGGWEIYESNLPEKLRGFHKQIVELVNDNIEKGCCGGCL